MSEKILTLPVPPSANRYWQVYRNRIVVTDEARAYKDHIRYLLCQSVPIQKGIPVAVNFSVFRPSMRGDLDNYNKVMLDALQGLVYVNDNQIVEIHSFRKDDKENPRVELMVYETDGYE